MPVTRTATLAVLSLLSLAPAMLAQQPAGTRPNYQFLRQNEDWTQFRAGEGASALDRLKHIELGDDGWAWLSLGGSFDARFESWDGFGFGAQPSNQEAFLLTRAMLHADLHLGERLRVFVEGKTAQSTDRDLPGGRRALDLDTIAGQQAFVDYDLIKDGEQRLRIRAGRQMFLLGVQRLIGPLPWANTLRTWDGVSADWSRGQWTVKGFWSQFVPVRKRKYNQADDDRELYGVYATRKPKDGERGLDVYAIGNTRPNVTVNGTTGNERRHTLGARSWGPLGGRFDGEVEGSYQFGDVGGQDVRAWSIASVLGFRPSDGERKPRIFLGVDAASGDKNPGGSVGTFHQLFPLGHAYFGWADVQGRQNVFAVHLGASAKLTPKTTAKLVAHTFRKLEGNDAFYFVNGARSAAQPSGREVAQEIDLHVAHVLSSQSKLYAGYSHVFSGSGLRDDISFFYLGCAWRF